MRQRNHGVKPQVGHFIDQLLRVTASQLGVFGGHHGFGGFFTNFLQKGVRPFVQQASHIAFFGVTASSGFAAVNHSRQARQRVGRSGGVHL